MRTLKAAAAYFGLVFGTGFVVGTIRTLWVVPRLGTRTAELIEAPLMLVVIILAAHWVVRRMAMPPSLSGRLGMGWTAFFLLLLAEILFVRYIRGISVRDYFVSRDLVSGTVYYVELGIMAVMPCLVGRKRR